MQIKKTLKYLPITLMTAGLIIATSPPLLFLLNNHSTKNSVNTNQQRVDINYTDQFKSSENYFQKDTSFSSPVKSIDIGYIDKNTSNYYRPYSTHSYHSAATVTKEDGSTFLYMWGQNYNGQLGIDSHDNKSSPTLVTSLIGKKITQVALGLEHSAAVMDDGSLYTWGKNSHGQLGDGTKIDKAIPTKIDTSMFKSAIKQIQLSINVSAALLEDGSMYMWGSGASTSLGNGWNGNENRPARVRTENFGSLKISQMSISGLHSAAIMEDGSLYTWGYGSALGLGLAQTGTSPMPTRVTSGIGSRRAVQISLGMNHTVVLLDDGNLYTCGYNNSGVLGISSSQVKHYNTFQYANNSAFPSPIKQIATGPYFSAALLTNGDMYMWGSNSRNSLGTGGGDTNFPTRVNTGNFSSKKITQISLGYYHSSARLEDGRIFSWGNNDQGQLGSGGNGQAVVPSWMSQLGKDSRITANSALTAKEAVDKFWIDGKFDLAGFKKSFNLTNILEVSNQVITLDKKPLYNNVRGSITMNPTIKYFYDENGLIVKDISTKPMTINGFLPGTRTDITAKTNAVNSIIVDKWLPYVTVDEKINRYKIEEFLTLVEVPDDAEFTIKDYNPFYKTGILSFEIYTDKVVDRDNLVQNITSDPYYITLNLTPRITKFVATTHSDDLLVTDCYNRIFNKAGLVNLTEFKKYIEIIVPVDNANYFLVPDTYSVHTGDGTASFKIYADKFYNSNGDEAVGGIDVVDSHFSVTLNLNPLASIMQVKNSYAADVRVDKFIASLGSIGVDGVIADPTILMQYIDFENIPSTAQYKISNIKDGDFNEQFIRNNITFDLTVTDFNQADGTVTPQTKTLTLTLGDQHMTTDIVLLDASLFPKDATPSRFKARMEKDGAVDINGTLTLTTANIEFLSKFLDFNSIPKDTVYTFTYNPVAPIDATNKLGFKLNINQYYDANSDLLTIPKDHTFILDLASEDYIPDPTILVTHAGSPVVNTEKDFLEQVYFDQKADLHNLSLYVDGLETIPTTADITIIKHQDSYNKVATFMIEVSGYYDGESSQMHVGPRTFNFQVNINNYQNPFSWWWWLVIAVGVTGAIGLLIWIPIHKWRKIKESDLL